MSAVTKGNRYDVERTLWEDATGVMSLGFDKKTSQSVLVRSFSAQLFNSTDQAKEFAKQIKAAAKKKTAGITPLVSLGISDGVPWIVMASPSAEGTTLRTGAPDMTLPELLQVARSAATTLDALHKSGTVHGDIRPETILPTETREALLLEPTATHLLCGWSANSHALTAKQARKYFSADFLAPEVAQGGEMNAVAERYAFAATLEQALPDLTGSPAAASMSAVIARAKSPQPNERFDSCADFVAALEKTTRAKSSTLPIAAGIAAVAGLGLIVAAYFAGATLGADTAKNNIAAEKSRLQAEVRQQYQVELPPPPAIVIDPRLAKIDPQTTSAVDAFFNRQSTPQLTSLLRGTRFDGDAKLQSTTADDDPNSQQSDGGAQIFLLKKSAIIAEGRPAAPIDWTIQFQVPSIGTPLVDYGYKVRVLDETGREIAVVEDQLDWAQTRDYSVGGTVTPVGNAWTSGRALVLDVSLSSDGKESHWWKSQTFGIATLTWKTTKLVVTPAEVRNAGFALRTGVQVRDGDVYRIKATGQITPASRANYNLLRAQFAPIGPSGLELTDKSVLQRYRLVEARLPWAALLTRIGQTAGSRWQPLPAVANQISGSGGELFLTINSITHSDGKIVTDPRFWLFDCGQFDVSINKATMTLPAGAPPELRNQILARNNVVASQQPDNSSSKPNRIDAPTAVGTFTGLWTDVPPAQFHPARNTLVELTDTGREIVGKLVSSPLYNHLEISIERKGTQLVVKRWQVKFRRDARQNEWDLNAELTAVGNQLFKFRTDTVHGSNIAGRKARVTSLDSSGFWYRCIEPLKLPGAGGTIQNPQSDPFGPPAR